MLRRLGLLFFSLSLVSEGTALHLAQKALCRRSALIAALAAHEPATRFFDCCVSPVQRGRAGQRARRERVAQEAVRDGRAAHRQRWQRVVRAGTGVGRCSARTLIAAQRSASFQSCWRHVMQSGGILNVVRASSRVRDIALRMFRHRAKTIVYFVN
eukprot:3624887-Pleurochrysis_carterae.AAC.10